MRALNVPSFKMLPHRYPQTPEVPPLPFFSPLPLLTALSYGALTALAAPSFQTLCSLRTTCRAVAANILINTAVAAAIPGQNPILSATGTHLRPFVHNQLQRAVLQLPGQDVAFVRGAITAPQLASHRPSYVNGILIQSRGQLERN